MNEIELFYRGCRLIGGQVTPDHWSIVAYPIEKAKTKIDAKLEETEA